MLTLLLLAGCGGDPGEAEQAEPEVCALLYRDSDDDGWGDSDVSVESCWPLEGWADAAGDCDEDDATVFPGAEELCDGLDHDCDGDAPPAVTWYRDDDRDGYGDPESPGYACEQQSLWVENAEDCDDSDSHEHPDAVWYPDDDDDNFGDEYGDAVQQCERPTGHVSTTGDCDDDDDSAHPGGSEYCDGVDDDCDGETDEAGAGGEQYWYLDADGDGWGGSTGTRACWRPPGHAEAGGDCDDDDASTWPGAPESDCDDPVDHNCDGSAAHTDRDRDGAEACADCDDMDADIGPAMVETCDGEDDDCDGEIDEGDAVGVVAWYPDEDLDGWAEDGEPTWSCDGGPRLALDVGDCDDDDATVNPDMDEACATDVDDDCDGDVNEADATGCVSWYPDADGDGWGADEVCTCTITTDTATGDGDCDDDAATANPDGVEVCGTGIDEDCAGSPQCGPAGDLTGDDAAVTVLGADWDDNLGGALAAVEDLDGDGVAELLVGVRGMDGDGSYSGGALVFGSPFSGTLGEADATAVLLGEGTSGWAGYGVAALGDTDGDGAGDVAIGAPSVSSGTGAVYVVSGADLSGDVALADQGARDALAWSDEFGSAVAGPGDVDGDGRADLLVGASGAGTGGVAYLFAGPVDGRADASDAVATLEGAVSGDSAGVTVGGTDFDGDGLVDLVIGASGANVAATNGGAVYVLYGPVSGSVTLSSADAIVSGESASGAVGAAVATGDTDGDGYPDLAIGAPYAAAPSSRAGGVYLVLGPPSGASGTADAAAWLTGQDRDEHAGIVVGLVDLDDDRRADLVSTSYLSSAAGDWGVRVYASPLSGAFSDDDAAGTIDGGSSGNLGKSLAAAGDTDADGYGDLWVGADDYDDGGTDAGAAFLFLGGPGH